MKKVIDFTFSSSTEDSHILQKKYYKTDFYSTMQPVYFTTQILGLYSNEFNLSKNFTVESKIKKDEKFVNSPNCIKVS